MGQYLRMHDSFWGLTDSPSFSCCQVVGYIGHYQFENGLSRHTYVIEHGGHFYPARHSAVAGALTDASVRRRVRKLNLPRVVGK